MDHIVAVIVNSLLTQTPSDFVMFLVGAAFGVVRAKLKKFRSRPSAVRPVRDGELSDGDQVFGRTEEN